ncbi:MAG: GNAT family N-acetyltransferase [Chitinophagales bacterium]
MFLETERLLLRPFTQEDAAFVLELVNTEGWLKNIGDRGVHTLEDAEAYLQTRIISAYEKYGYGLNALIQKTDDTLIGMVGLVNRDSLQHPDLGFAVLPAYMGKGYTTEIAQVVLEYADEVLDIAELSAITIPENMPSRRVLEKCGFQLSGEMTEANGDRLLVYSRAQKKKDG